MTFYSGDLDLGPMTLIYEVDLDILKMYVNTKNELSTSMLSDIRAWTGRHTDTCDPAHYDSHVGG